VVGNYLAISLPRREIIILGKAEFDSHGWKVRHNVSTHLIVGPL
jgi:hypothetical protein